MSGAMTMRMYLSTPLWGGSNGTHELWDRSICLTRLQLVVSGTIIKGYQILCDQKCIAYTTTLTSLTSFPSEETLFHKNHIFEIFQSYTIFYVTYFQNHVKGK